MARSRAPRYLQAAAGEGDLQRLAAGHGDGARGLARGHGRHVGRLVRRVDQLRALLRPHRHLRALVLLLADLVRPRLGTSDE